MKIKRVILSTDNNSFYYQFWSTVAKCWSSWGVIPTLCVISENKIEEIDESLGDVYYIKPNKNYPIAQQSQICRFFLAAQFPEDVCLISDIDMAPLNKNYFLDGVKNFDEEDFVVYSSDAYSVGNPAYPAYPMCYMASKGKNFKQIIGGNLNNFTDVLPSWMSMGFGWHTDEKAFFIKLKKWEKQIPKNKKIITLKRGFQINSSPIGIRRIDRGTASNYNEKLLLNNFYIDYHMPRPYDKNKEIIDNIIKLSNQSCYSVKK